MTPPRWRFSATGAFGARRASDSFAFCLRSRSAALLGAAADLVGGGFGLRGTGAASGRGWPRSARDGAGASGVATGQLVEVGAALGELGLELEAGLADLGVVLRMRLSVALGGDVLAAQSSLAALFGLSLCTRLRHCDLARC